MDRDINLSSVVNSARSCNIFNSSTESDLQDVIQDYFIKDFDEKQNTDSDSDTSDGDLDSSARPTPGTSRDVASASGTEERSDHDDSDDEPLVGCTDAGSVPADIGVFGSDVDVEKKRVQSFKCGCRMLSKKSDRADTRCYSQFSADEVTNTRMEMSELLEG